MRLRLQHAMLFVLLPLFTSASTLRSPAPDRPYELTIHRTLSSTPSPSGGSPCTHVALRRVQPHKRVRAGAGPLVKRSYATARGERVHASAPDAAEERVRAYAAPGDLGLLWEHAKETCGDEKLWLGRAYLPDDFGLAGVHGAGQSRSAQVVFEDTLESDEKVEAPPLTIVPLLVSGPSSNRVDLTFFADGYTADEFDAFVADARRLAEDVARNKTFAPVRPLLNFWAAFTPSNESGIGVGGKPKDTAFGLYRDGTELRGVYYAKPEVAHAACYSLGDACDYPILVGNDALYGGLGGTFTVITPSLANGPLVLRHELGHSIIEIGEEYDGGDFRGYFGINAGHNRSELPWAHWLSAVNSSSRAHASSHEHHLETFIPREERGAMPFQAYAWTILNTSSSWRATFNSTGNFSRHILRFSLSGLPDADDLRVLLDGKDAHWKPADGIGRDRWHYDLRFDSALSEGAHDIQFELRNEEREEAQLCSVEVLEFGDEDEFNTTPGFVGAFPTFSEDYRTSYRPTNEACLMRVVTTPDFCSVCTEGLWLSLLARVELVESLVASCAPASPPGHFPIPGRPKKLRRLEAALVPLAHLRASADEFGMAASNESYTIRWFRQHEEVRHARGKTVIELDGDDEDALGEWEISVQFETDEIRQDMSRMTRGWAGVFVSEKCP